MSVPDPDPDIESHPMRFLNTPLEGTFVLEPQPSHDQRGFFARTWCEDEARKNGIESRFVQVNISQNLSRGTVRGLHYQAEPLGEAKVVQCVRGSVFDVVLDLRAGSSSFKRVFYLELSRENRRMLYIPRGLAHGFQTLEDDTEVQYFMSEYYHPEAARGIRWDDPGFDIPWPLGVSAISEKDLSYPNFKS